MAGLTSDAVGLTVEVKPRRRNKRSVLYDLTPEFSQATGRAQGSWSRLEARHIHMLLQNELFINVATVHNQDGELRGQIKALLYNGLEAPRHGSHAGSNGASRLPAAGGSHLVFFFPSFRVAGSTGWTACVSPGKDRCFRPRLGVRGQTVSPAL